MAIPNSRAGRSGEGRGYPRPSSPRPNSSEYSGGRSFERNTDSDKGESTYRRPNSDESSNSSARPYRPASAPVATPQPKPAPIVNQFVLTDDLRELIKLVADTDLTEVMLENAGWKVHIKREKHQPVVEYVTPTPTSVRNAQGALSPTAPALPSPAAAPHVVEENYHKVTAPMVGIFYRAPDPKARPFAQEGEMVEKGQVIGIIEAMKIMNEITSEHSGRCVSVKVENGQPVEYGQTLLLLEPA